jgi:hypothetical protein
MNFMIARKVEGRFPAARANNDGATNDVSSQRDIRVVGSLDALLWSIQRILSATPAT